eukprot:1996566-Rhodomonas_salina.1
MGCQVWLLFSIRHGHTYMCGIAKYGGQTVVEEWFDFVKLASNEMDVEVTARTPPRAVLICTPCRPDLHPVAP